MLECYYKQSTHITFTSTYMSSDAGWHRSSSWWLISRQKLCSMRPKHVRKVHTVRPNFTRKHSANSRNVCREIHKTTAHLFSWSIIQWVLCVSKQLIINSISRCSFVNIIQANERWTKICRKYITDPCLKAFPVSLPFLVGIWAFSQ